ncbi:carcinoembryonic antigen-related cell adhesion molecule 6-like [Echinops telfairi]|uniref:Carcinoembryonic antigen-related cell adhesion molecule 6-like n=1 Tax=Echinops telfairi TaxID=9371 RepID=A0ABM1VKM8_ECHTE|nr:carcinoembryonic antigen-related cell adhesion molecule 6-like [Echinops telfairi]
MEPPSVTPSKGHSSWQGTLLTVSLLLSWSPPTAAQLTLESMPRAVAEGQDVLLLNPSRAVALVYSWYKGDSIEPKDLIVSYVLDTGETTHGPAHTGREALSARGSLILHNVTLADAGTYTLHVRRTKGAPKKWTGQIHVFRKLPKPSIKSSSSNPVGDKDSVTLLCEPETQNTTSQWLINSQSLPDNSRLELSMDNRTLTIHTVTRNESGLYNCRTRNPVSSSHSDSFSLKVLYGPDTPTISPSAEHSSLGNNINLTCQAVSNSCAQYSWFINETSRQSTEQLFIPDSTVGDSGNYICRVHNPATALSRTTAKTITVSVKWLPGMASPKCLTKPSIRASNTTGIKTTGAVVFTCLTKHNGISISWFHDGERLQLTERMELSQDNSSLTINPVRVEDAGNYQCEVSNPGSANRSDSLTLTVEESLTKPSIKASNTTITENMGPVVFTCLTKHSGISISWFHDGERLRLTERMKLSQDNSSLTINPVRMEDAGNYQCDRSEGGLVVSAETIPRLVIAALVIVLLVVTLGYFLFRARTRRFLPHKVFPGDCVLSLCNHRLSPVMAPFLGEQ